MINWEESLKIHGTDQNNPKTRNKVVVECTCTKRQDVIYRVALKQIAKYGTYKCHDCITKSKEFKSECSDRAKAKWEDQEYIKNNLEAIRSVETRAKNSARVKRLWESDIYKANHAIGLSKLGPRVSSIQLKLYSYLDDLGVLYHKEGTETTIGYYTFDCMIEHNNKKLLIECQGDYWHTKPETERKDKVKFEYISRYFPEYEIIYIWEHEFVTKDCVIGRLKSKLGISQHPVEFEFSQIKISETSRGEINSFLDAYHYIGKGGGGVAFSASVSGVVVAAIVYSSQIRQNSHIQYGVKSSRVKEISRLCIHPSYHKKNFASWFIAMTRRRIDADIIVAFADSTAGHVGTVYKASGFILDHETESDYWYVNQAGYVMHKKTLYDRASKCGMKEADYASKFEYFRKWGGKKFCYVYRVIASKRKSI